MMNLIDFQAATENLLANSLGEVFSLATPDLFTPLSSRFSPASPALAMADSPLPEISPEINVGQKREPDAANDTIIISENTSTVIELLKNDFGDLDVIIGNDGTNFLWPNNVKFVKRGKNED